MALAVAPAAGSVALAANPSIETFQPHRASYELLLVPGRGDGSVSGGGGRLDFEWADACEGWAVNQRTRVVLSESNGGELDFGWALTTEEAKDGLAFEFVIQRFQNGAVYETVRGDAALESDGSGGKAVFEEPVARTVDLPPGTLFPTAHTFAMLEAAREKRLPIYELVFDASSEADGLAAVATALGARIPAERPATLDSPLLTGGSWRLLLAYFPPFGQAELPDTEVALRVFANGIADDFVFDYGDFALRARLTELQALPEPEC